MPPPAGAAASPAEQPELDIPACDRWSWDQGDTEVKLILRGLPLATKAKDVKLTSKALTLSLSVGGEVVLDNAKLHKMVVSDETDFDLQDAPGRQSRVLTLTMLKASPGGVGATPWPTFLKEE